MRRLLLSAAGLGLLAVFTGCNHMAGACDCDMTPTIACPCVHPATLAGPPPALVKPEPIKELPKVKPDKEPDKED